MHRLIPILFTAYWGMLIALLASNPPAAALLLDVRLRLQRILTGNTRETC